MIPVGSVRIRLPLLTLQRITPTAGTVPCEPAGPQPKPKSHHGDTESRRKPKEKGHYQRAGATAPQAIWRFGALRPRSQRQRRTPNKAGFLFRGSPALFRVLRCLCERSVYQPTVRSMKTHVWWPTTIPLFFWFFSVTLCLPGGFGFWLRFTPKKQTSCDFSQDALAALPQSCQLPPRTAY